MIIIATYLFLWGHITGSAIKTQTLSDSYQNGTENASAGRSLLSQLSQNFLKIHTYCSKYMAENEYVYYNYVTIST